MTSRPMAAPDETGIAGALVPREREAVKVAQMRRHEELGEVASDGHAARMSERPLRRRIEFDDAAAVIDDDDAVERRFNRARGAEDAVELLAEPAYHL